MEGFWVAPLLLPLAAAALAAQSTAVFYMENKPESMRAFFTNAEKIGILVPTFYSADEQGGVTGEPNAEVLETARRRGVPVMPIVVNPGFKQETVHRMLANPVARARLAQNLLAECRRHKYYGIQLDLENIPASDREALTLLVRDTAALLAPDGFQLSIATMYQRPEAPGEGGYARWLYDNWLGAYDLAEITKHVEFVSLMTYDHHTERTPPGPIAGFPWVEEILGHCLKLVPKEKLSLGIPLYGRRWYAGALRQNGAMLTATVNAPEAGSLAAERKAAPLWDPLERAPWYYFYRDGIREYVFYNDARSFRERYELVRQRSLHGFSAWVLGAEDPEIWKVLPAARR